MAISTGSSTPFSRLAGAVVVALLTAAAVRAQPVVNGVNYTRFSVFRIPFQTESGERRIKQIHLLVSNDLGQTWQTVTTVGPEQRHFDYPAQRDGLYWFAVRTTDIDGRDFPAANDAVRPGLKVVVDTKPPAVRLRGVSPREGQIGVEWEVRDENLDAGSLRLDYHLVGSTEWLPLGGDLPALGQRYWRPATNGAVEVRLRARDLADNWNEDKVTLTPDGSSAASAGAGNAEPSSPVSPGTPVRLVNSQHISLNYEVKDRGPSGISGVELWYTQNPAGRTWQKYREEKGDAHAPLTFDVQGEGLYGFTIIIKSGVGLSERPPQVGDQPQIWVEVDLTKPVVRIGEPEVGRGADTDRLTITWSATDKNLGKQPITISYAEQTSGPWTAIAPNLENTGRYIWQMPQTGTPYRFYVRVEAVDRAGNVGSAETAQPVIVDLYRPKAVNLTVDPAAK
jgi:hypothetical protein